jgi:hypothetical protein
MENVCQFAKYKPKILKRLTDEVKSWLLGQVNNYFLSVSGGFSNTNAFSAGWTSLATSTVAVGGCVVTITGLKCLTSFTAKSSARLPSTLNRVKEQLLTVVRHQRQRFSGRYHDSAAEITPAWATIATR